MINNEINSIAKTTREFGNRETIGTWQGTDSFSNQQISVLYNADLHLEVPTSLEELKEECKPDLPWADVHYEERISGEPLNPGESYKIWPYHNFKEDGDEFKRHDGKFSHTYMERYSNTYLNIIKLLKKKPTTRQAYFPIFLPLDVEASLKGDRVPCTLGYHIFVNNSLKALHLNYYIRSCDLYRHLRNDIYLTSRLLQTINSECYNNQFKSLEMTMYISNLHLFRVNEYNLKKDNRWDI